MTFVWRSAGALLITALLSACGSDGPVREPAELQDIVSPKLQPRVLWQAAPGEGADGEPSGLRPAVEMDVVLVADVNGDVFALDPQSGRRLWHAATDARVIAGPAVSGDLVLLGTKDAEVIALKRADGAPVWRATVSSEVLAPPVGEGNVIVVRAGDGKLFGLSAADGKRLWSFDRAMPQLTLRGMSAPLIFGTTVLTGLDNGRVVALKLDSGDLLWEQVVAAPSGRNDLERIVDVDADPLITVNGVYAVSFGGELAAVSLDNGRVAWRRPIKSYSGIALAGNLLAVTDQDGLVWGLDAETGAAAWKQEALQYRKLSPPVAADGYFVVADLEGYLHWLSPQDGSIVARVRPVDGQVTAPIVARDGRLYVYDSHGGLAAIEPAPPQTSAAQN